MTDTTTAHHDVVEPPGHPAGDGLIKPEYDDRLANADLAPLKKQTWSSYNIFAFWMSDVHSVGGYVTAGACSRSASPAGRCWSRWSSASHRQVLLQPGGEAQPGDRRARTRSSTGPSSASAAPTSRRSSAGSSPSPGTACRPTSPPTSLIIIFLKFFPGLLGRAATRTTFLGLSPLGYICYAILWVAQAAVFWRGMEAIQRFIDWAGPAVYVVMVVLASTWSRRPASATSASTCPPSSSSFGGLDPGDARRDRRWSSRTSPARC